MGLTLYDRHKAEVLASAIPPPPERRHCGEAAMTCNRPALWRERLPVSAVVRRQNGRSATGLARCASGRPHGLPVPNAPPDHVLPGEVAVTYPEHNPSR